ncbi:hypothetical protein BDR03DRAFT_945365 [Suillus americanus]|nr:hypothetical protein BDR03DRAFT_945365 [Suillus americanus]
MFVSISIPSLLHPHPHFAQSHSPFRSRRTELMICRYPIRRPSGKRRQSLLCGNGGILALDEEVEAHQLAHDLILLLQQ